MIVPEVDDERVRIGEERHRSCRDRMAPVRIRKAVELHITDVPAEAFYSVEPVVAGSCLTQFASGARGRWRFSRSGNRQRGKPRAVDQVEMLIVGDFGHLRRQKVAERFGTRDGVVFSACVPLLKQRPYQDVPVVLCRVRQAPFVYTLSLLSATLR